MIDKQQALFKFWSGFGLPAYEQTTVPDNAELPYITYETATADLDQKLVLSGHLWERTTKWLFLDNKANEISRFIEEMSPIKIDEGYVYITKENPFARRLSDENDSNIRGYAFNIGVEFFTNN